jgi:putative salt-induced outer membrane protein
MIKRLFALFVVLAVPAAGQDPCPCPEPAPPPPPLWTGSIGLSYLSNSGNSESDSLGLSASFARQPTPWGLEVSVLANRAETDGVKSAERYFAELRGKRALGDRYELFAGGGYERDKFAGFDSRTVLEAGGIWRAVDRKRQRLAFDLGLTWTSESPVAGERLESFGAVAGLEWNWKLSETASFRERLVYYPNFDDSEDWRLRSETSLEAALASSWALRLSYLVTRDNLPAPGFERTDTATSVSLVWKR